MNASNEHDDLRHLWQGDAPAAPDPERVARLIMAQTWRFDHKVFWRNAREYIAGAVAIVGFGAQAVVGYERARGVAAVVCVSFVMLYLWWQHRTLHPLDPAADAASYRRALLARIDNQIALLRGVPYWYLLPLAVPIAWSPVADLPRKGWVSLIPLACLIPVVAFVGWLNARAGVRVLRSTRDQVAAVLPDEP